MRLSTIPSGGMACVAAAMMAISGAAPARADFGTPVTLSRAGQNAMGGQPAFGAYGDAVIVWFRSDGTSSRVQARFRSAKGVLSPTQTLSAAGQNALEAQVAVDADGDAVVVWERFDGTSERIQARTRSAAGVLGPIKSVSTAGQDAYSPQVAVDADGNAVIVWWNATTYRIQGRALSVAGVLGPIQTLSAAGQSADSPRIAIQADGDALIVWRRSDGTSFRIQARTRSATGVLGRTQTLSAAGRHAYSPHLGLDAEGNAVIVWYRSDGTNNRVQARARSATGVLGPIRTLSAAGQNAADAQVAVDADGDALIVWYRWDGTNYRVQARSRSSTDALGPIRTLSAAGRNARAAQVAIDVEGNGVVVWEGFDGTNRRIQARTRSAADALGPAQTLSAAGRDAANPRVAVDADGDALAVWWLFDGTSYRIQAATGP